MFVVEGEWDDCAGIASDSSSSAGSSGNYLALSKLSKTVLGGNACPLLRKGLWSIFCFFVVSLMFIKYVRTGGTQKSPV